MEPSNLHLIYEREEQLTNTLLSQKPHKLSLIVTLSVLLLIAIITLAYWQDVFGLSKYMPAVGNEVFLYHQWWRPFTAIFIHGDLGHILSNSYMLGVFSYFIFGYFGFGIYPLMSFVLGAVVNVLAIATYPPDLRLLGASGLVYLLGGFWLTMYVFIQRQYTWFNRVLRVLGIGIMIFFPTTFQPTTSYRTHAIGFGVGVLFATYFFFRKRRWIRAQEIYKVTHIAT